MTKYNSKLTRRRSLFALGAGALLTATLPSRHANADTAANAATADAPPAAPIEQLNGALLSAMKAGGRTSFAERYRALGPIVGHVFDLNEVLARSVGLSWATMPQAQKDMLAAAFERYTVSSYVSNFDSFSGQTFQVSPTVRTTGNGEVVVRSQLQRGNGAPVTLDYVMRRGPAGWQAVDVLMDGAISRVAVQRSDFRGLLASGGVPALAASLEHKVANLSGGMVG